jgi:hypothetical protein
MLLKILHLIFRFFLKNLYDSHFYKFDPLYMIVKENVGNRRKRKKEREILWNI